MIVLGQANSYTPAAQAGEAYTFIAYHAVPQLGEFCEMKCKRGMRPIC